MRIRLWIVCVLAALTAPNANAGPFTFAGFTFEQANTPDTIALLGNGNSYGGVTFSSNLPNTITQSVGFGSVSGSSGAGFVPVPGWIPRLSIGEQATDQLGVKQSDGTGSLFSSALNLPRGNNGTTTRHGLAVSWSSGQGLINGAGNDFVVYESGSNSTSPEGFMVRVGYGDGTYSDWYYNNFDSYQVYTNTPATVEGAFATAFDLSDLGVGAGMPIFSIEIANLIAADRVGSLAGGVVNFNGVGANPNFGSGGLDPDPLYVGILGDLTPLAAVPEPISLAAWSMMATAGMVYGWRKRRRAV